MALHKIEEFTWHKATKTLTVEASDIGFTVLEPWMHIVGHTCTKFFNFAGEERDNDGDVMYWAYLSTDGFTIKIWND